MTKPHVGIDVAKDQLDVWVWETATGDSVPHNEAGIEALCTRLEALAPDRIVVEATGGREVPLAAALQAAGLPVAVVNPRQARAFGRALGQLAKTDCLDARLLARMAAVLRDPNGPLYSKCVPALTLAQSPNSCQGLQRELKVPRQVWGYRIRWLGVSRRGYRATTWRLQSNRPVRAGACPPRRPVRSSCVRKRLIVE